MMIRIGNFLFHYRNGLFPLAYLLLVWRSPIFAENYAIAVTIGAALALVGQAIRAITIGLDYIHRGGKDRQVYADHLVQGGIFAHCRNPLYIGNFLVLCGLGFAADSKWFLIAGVPLFAFAYCAIIAAEENYLRGKFGPEYDRYCAQVHRFVPKLKGLRATLHGMEFKWRRLLVKEYGSTYAWMAGMVALIIKNFWLDARGRMTPEIWMLQGLLVVLTLAYGCARYVKKRRIVRAD